MVQNYRYEDEIDWIKQAIRDEVNGEWNILCNEF
jgi:hypothetical protein